MRKPLVKAIVTTLKKEAAEAPIDATSLFMPLVNEQLQSTLGQSIGNTGTLPAQPAQANPRAFLYAAQTAKEMQPLFSLGDQLKRRMEDEHKQRLFGQRGVPTGIGGTLMSFIPKLLANRSYAQRYGNMLKSWQGAQIATRQALDNAAQQHRDLRNSVTADFRTHDDPQVRYVGERMHLLNTSNDPNVRARAQEEIKNARYYGKSPALIKALRQWDVANDMAQGEVSKHQATLNSMGLPAAKQYIQTMGYAFDPQGNIVGAAKDPRTVMKLRGAVPPA